MADMTMMLFIISWAFFGLLGWWQIVKRYGFTLTDLVMIPLAMFLGPIALLAYYVASRYDK